MASNSYENGFEGNDIGGIKAKAISHEDLVEALMGKSSEDHEKVATHNDWKSLVSAINVVYESELSDKLSSVPQVLSRLDLPSLVQSVEGFVYHAMEFDVLEDSLDSKLRLQRELIGPLMQDAQIILLQEKDADIVSGKKPESMKPEDFTSSYIHSDAIPDVIAKIKELSELWVSDISKAKERNDAVLLGVVEDVEDSTKGNIEVLYSLGFTLKNRLVSDPRLHYINIDPNIKKVVIKYTKDWIEANKGFRYTKKRRLEGVSKVSRIPAENLRRIVDENIELTKDQAFYIATAIAEVDKDYNNPFSWQKEFVIGVQRDYVKRERSRILRGRSQLDYSDFKVFVTNIPSLVREVRGDLLPLFYSPGTEDAWQYERWGPLPNPAIKERLL